MKRLLVLALIACESQPGPVGIDEPLRVRGAQFIEGPLPHDSGGPAVTFAASENPIILAGQAQKLFSGRALATASAVAVRFADVGSGHWIFPIGDPDPQYPGELTWSASADFSRAIAPGRRALAFSAIDGAGRAGPVRELAMCVGSRIPDNQHACDPAEALPAVVMSLSWDVDVDLDLVVVAPDGRELTAKKSRKLAGEPFFDRDSLARCLPDATRTENLVFPARPSGRYAVFVSLFDPCNVAAVRFTFEAYEGGVRARSDSGRMIALDANGGRDRGLFVTELLY
jgi:hypothetical protein